MKVSKNEFAHALTVLGKIVNKTSAVDIYKSIKIEALGEDRLQLTACSTDEQLTMTMPAHGTDRFVAVVPYLMIRNIIKGSNAGIVDLEMKNNVLAIQVCAGGRITENELPCICDTYPDVIEPPDNATMNELPLYTIEVLKMAAMVVDRKEVRAQLRGINLSSNGITATNGKELVNVPCPDLSGLAPVTIPFPSALLICRQEERGVLKTWLRNPHEADVCFCITIGNLRWQGTAIHGNYPNWQQIVPAKETADYNVHIDLDDCDHLVAYLKRLPDKQPYLPVTLSMPDAKTLVVASDNTSHSVAASARTIWGTYSMTLDKNVLLRLLQMGHNHIDCRIHHSPFIASGGLGCFVAMPLLNRNAKTEAQSKTEDTGETQKTVAAMEKESTITEKEKQNMEDQITTNTNANENANTNANENVNALDELSSNLDAFKARLKILYDESNQLTRKIKEAQLQQKQKERDFILAKRAIERIRMAI